MALRLGARDPLAPDRLFGRVELRRLDWDTTFFGRKMGRLALTRPDATIDVLASELRHALAEAADDGYAHVILRVPADHHRASQAAEQAGLRLVDVALDLCARAPQRRAALVGPTIRPATAEDVDALRRIAEDAFYLSRFTADPFFAQEQAAAFYRQWISNLCDGLAATVLVAEASDEIAGFCACALEPREHGRIPLIATSEAHRRQGVARALVEASLQWFGAAGCRSVYVKTQAANYPALTLYQRCGFVVDSAELTFSASLGPPTRLS